MRADALATYWYAYKPDRKYVEKSKGGEYRRYKDGVTLRTLASPLDTRGSAFYIRLAFEGLPTK